MPSRHSQQTTKSAAHVLAEELGVTLQTISIDEATDREIEATTAMLGGAAPTEATRQNVQARLRGQRMWNWANSSGALFLQTGDMSEKAVGYTTIGGDLEGRAVGHRQRAQDGRHFASAAVVETIRVPGDCRHAPNRSRARARRCPGRRTRADALPGPRRVPPLVRHRKDVAAGSGRGPGVAVSRRIVRVPPGLGGSIHRRCSRSRFTSGSSHRSPFMSVPWTSTESARCSCPSCSRTSGRNSASLFAIRYSRFAVRGRPPSRAYALSPAKRASARQSSETETENSTGTFQLQL